METCYHSASLCMREKYDMIEDFDDCRWIKDNLLLTYLYVYYIFIVLTLVHRIARRNLYFIDNLMTLLRVSASQVARTMN